MPADHRWNDRLDSIQPRPGVQLPDAPSRRASLDAPAQPKFSPRRFPLSAMSGNLPSARFAVEWQVDKTATVLAARVTRCSRRGSEHPNAIGYVNSLRRRQPNRYARLINQAALSSNAKRRYAGCRMTDFRRVHLSLRSIRNARERIPGRCRYTYIILHAAFGGLQKPANA